VETCTKLIFTLNTLKTSQKSTECEGGVVYQLGESLPLSREWGCTNITTRSPSRKSLIIYTLEHCFKNGSLIQGTKLWCMVVDVCSTTVHKHISSPLLEYYYRLKHHSELTSGHTNRL